MTYTNLQLILIVFILLPTITTSEPYKYTVENVELRMPDDVHISVTLSVPISTRSDETFPVLLQYKPYRKDDILFYSDQADARYLARRGFIVSVEHFVIFKFFFEMLRLLKLIYVAQAHQKVS